MDPDVDAIARACEITYGSLCECFASTECRMERKLGFSTRESGVGGSWAVVPIASWALGGEVGSRVRRWLLKDRSSGKTNWGQWLAMVSGLHFMPAVLLCEDYPPASRYSGSIVVCVESNKNALTSLLSSSQT